MRKIVTIILFIAFAAYNNAVCSAGPDTPSAGKTGKTPVIAPSYAWRLMPPLGVRVPATIDTVFQNYSMEFVPSLVSHAYATTGTLGAEGYNMLYFDRKEASDFFFRDAMRSWVPDEGSARFYNTRIPMTLLSYSTGGDRDNSPDRLQAVFSGNANKRLQIGAMIDYLYAKGCYNYLAAKHLTWGFSGSYIGDHVEVQTFYNHYNALNQENGGITDDLYITDPAEIQGGSNSIDPKTIPTKLTQANNRLKGNEFYLNAKYNVGHWREIEEEDTVTAREFVPVANFIWTLDYNQSTHKFRNVNAIQDREFWDFTYFNAGKTLDEASYNSLRNTLGVSVLEGFSRYAKAGLAAMVTHELRRFHQPVDPVYRENFDPDDSKLDPLPFSNVPRGATENLLWVGAQLTRQHGRVLNYDATAEIGIAGKAAGEVKVNGNISTRFPLFKDTVTLKAYGLFSNKAVPYFLQHYVSNHFAWDNDFGKTRRLRFGGELDLARTRTRLNIGVENVQNLVYFDNRGLPAQERRSIQVFSANLQQNFKFGIFNWQNALTYQTSSNEAALPLPKFVVYSNMFIDFRIVKLLQVQLGIDCDYYTRYKAVDYQPATMSFYNQDKVKCGNFAVMNAYINMKLKKARFYVMVSHVNQGLTGNNYFSMPHYPINPRLFQVGIAVDFAN